MKKTNPRKREDDLRDEYGPALIKKGVRGKYAAQYRQGTNLVLLAPDVAPSFPTAESVNDALRLLIKVAGSVQKAPAK
jgi:hypothetical protein